MSCCKCYVIDEACFRRILGPRLLSANLTFYDMESAWRLGHDLDIIPIIGATCYDEFCERKADNEQTPADLALTQSIQDYATWAIYARLLEQQPSVGVTPAGFTATFEDSFEHAPATPRNELAATAVKYRNVYKVLFMQWLADNAADYPCYVAPVETCGCADEKVYMNSITGLKRGTNY